MAIKLSNNFELNSAMYLDKRIQVSSLTDLRNWNTDTNPIPNGFEACVNGTWYVYNSSNDPDDNTGRFRLRADAIFQSGQAVPNLNLISNSAQITQNNGNIPTCGAIYDYVDSHGGGGGDSTFTGGQKVSETTISDSAEDINANSSDICRGSDVYNFVMSKFDESKPFTIGVTANPDGGTRLSYSNTGQVTFTFSAVKQTSSGNKTVTDSTTFKCSVNGGSSWTDVSNPYIIENITGYNQTKTYTFKGHHSTYGDTNSTPKSYTFGLYYYYGVTTKYVSGTNEPDISVLTRKGPSLKTNISETFATPTMNDFPVIIYPSDWGTVTYITDGLSDYTDSFALYGTIQVSVNGTNVNYKAYQKKIGAIDPGIKYTFTIS